MKTLKLEDVTNVRAWKGKRKYVGNIEELNGMDFEEAKEALGL